MFVSMFKSNHQFRASADFDFALVHDLKVRLPMEIRVCVRAWCLVCLVLVELEGARILDLDARIVSALERMKTEPKGLKACILAS